MQNHALQQRIAQAEARLAQAEEADLLGDLELEPSRVAILQEQLDELISQQEVVLGRFEHTLEENKQGELEWEELVSALKHEEPLNDFSASQVDDLLRSSANADLFASETFSRSLASRVFEQSYLFLLRF